MIPTMGAFDFIASFVTSTGTAILRGLLFAAITDAGVAPLTDLPLSSLYLSGTRITDATLDLIGRKNELMFLAICRTAITDDGIRSVAKMRGLWSLAMDDTAITDNALDALIESQRLSSISVHGTAVSPEAINFYKTRWTIQDRRISDD